MAVARITSKGQITVPKEVRDRLGVEPGDSLAFEFRGEQVEVRPVKRRSITEFYGRFKSSTHLSWEEARELGWREATKRLVPGEAPADD